MIVVPGDLAIGEVAVDCIQQERSATVKEHDANIDSQTGRVHAVAVHVVAVMMCCTRFEGVQNLRSHARRSNGLCAALAGG